MPSVHVDFQHWSYKFPSEVLVKYGSPHYSSKEVRDFMVNCIDTSYHDNIRQKGLFDDKNDVGRFKILHSCDMNFDMDHLICANEAYPEAAVSDPLADLEVWDQWNNGIRTFPYPGKFSRLGIVKQKEKTTSTSSVGVLGEIIAGLFAQAGISNEILVRVIRRWPDFIYFHSDTGRYSFVEAKAFTSFDNYGNRGLFSRVKKPLIGECMENALIQLNADPFIKIWGAFTNIKSINPWRLAVTFLEIDADDERRNERKALLLPAPVIKGLSERAVSQASINLDTKEMEILYSRSSKVTQNKNQLRHKLSIQAEIEIEEILTQAGLDKALSSSRKDFTDEIKKIVALVKSPLKNIGKRFFKIKENPSEYRFQVIRNYFDKCIFMQDNLNAVPPTHSADQLSWEKACHPWAEVGGNKIWRCGGALFTLMPSDFDGYF